MDLLKKAKTILDDGNYTCVLCSEWETITSVERGVKSLTDLIDSGRNVSGMSAADTVVGRGAAFLYVKLGVREIFAGVISDPAAEVLSAHGIEFRYDKKVPNIINRDGTGLCPMEEATLGTDDPEEAFRRVRAKQEELKKKNAARS